MKDERLIQSLTLSFSHLHIEQLLDTSLGVTVLPIDGPVPELVKRLSELSKNFDYHPASTTSTNVVQNFSSFSDFSPESIWHKLANKIAREIEVNFDLLGCQELLTGNLSFTDLALQFYPQSQSSDAYGISPHRDQSGYVNLVVVLLLFGPAAFNVCEDKGAANSINIDAKPGDLILMRGGGFGRSLPRPHHFVGRIEDPQGRLSFGMRQITSDTQEAKKLREIFTGGKL